MSVSRSGPLIMNDKHKFQCKDNGEYWKCVFWVWCVCFDCILWMKSEYGGCDRVSLFVKWISRMVCCMIIVVVSLYVFWWVRLHQERPYNHENTDTRLLIEVKHDLVEVVLRWGTTLEFSMLFLKFPFAFFTSILWTSFIMHFITDIIRFKWHGPVRINILFIYIFPYVSTDRYFSTLKGGENRAIK